MTQKTVTRRICDRDKTNPANEVHFAVGGTPYTVDLCEGCEDELLKALEPFLALAAVVRRPYKRADRVPRVGAGAVRVWAVENGIEVGPRGRISRELEDRYLAAHK